MKTHCMELIPKTEEYLRENRDFLTDGTILAGEDMLRQARLAIEGKNPVPFNRNRAFYSPRPEEEITFAFERYTMCPTYLHDGKVYGAYGLKPCFEWIQTQNFSGFSMEELKARHQTLFVLKKELDLSQGLSERGKENLERCMDTLDDTDQMAYAKGLVSCYNALRLYRHSRESLNQIQPGTTLLLSGEQMQQLKSGIGKPGRLCEIFQEIRSIADQNTPEYIDSLKLLKADPIDYAEANKIFYLWSGTDRIMNFTTPDGAAFASLAFLLHGEEPLEHVWFADVQVLGANQPDWEIPNWNFEAYDGNKMEGWSPVVLNGSPTLTVESQPPYCGKRTHSLKIHNRHPHDYGGWKMDDVVPIEENASYTLCFLAKLDGKVNRGLEARVTYYDPEKREIGQRSCYFRRKSGLMGAAFALTMQCDAFIYAITGDEAYARKARKQIDYFFHEFSQGIEHWLVTNERPHGSDCYGAVQAGRLLCSAAFAYDLIRDTYSMQEREELYRSLDYYLRYLLDLRDRTELPPADAQKNCSNWQMDMCAGTAMMMLAVDDAFHNRKTWLFNAQHVLKAQLIHNLNDDGSWPESIRYHFSALMRFADMARVMRNVLQDDWYQSTRFLKMFEYPCLVQTPKYKYFGDTVSTFPFGDHVMSLGGGYAIFRSNLDIVACYNSILADQMYDTWVSAGSPQVRYHTEDLVLHRLLAAIPYRKTEEAEHLPPAAISLPQAGLHIFRNTPEDALCVMSSEKPIAHGHLDQGSFVWFVAGAPLILDPGVEGYFDGSVQWFLSSSSHSCLQLSCPLKSDGKQVEGFINLTAGDYSERRGWMDTPRQSELMDICQKEGSMTLRIQYPNGAAHLRSYTLIDRVLLIEDEVRSFEKNVRISLPVVSGKGVVKGNHARFSGLFGYDLSVWVDASGASLLVEPGRCSSQQIPPTEKGCFLTYLRAEASPDRRTATILSAYPVDTPAPLLEKTAFGYHIKTKQKTVTIPYAG